MNHRSLLLGVLAAMLGLACGRAFAEQAGPLNRVEPLPVLTEITNTLENAVPVVVQNPDGDGSGTGEYRFIGFSSAPINPGPTVGFAGMHGACQADFGKAARMCVAIEVVKTPELTSLTQNAVGWVQSVRAGVLSDLRNCNSWTGLFVNPTGPESLGAVLNGSVMSFDADICANSHPVACCAPR